MRSRKNDVTEDTYIVKTMERDVKVSGSILESLEALGKSFGWNPSNYKELSHGMYHGRISKDNSVYALIDERRWYNESEVVNWKSAINKALAEISFENEKQKPAVFEKFSLDKKILPIPEEFISSVQNGDIFWQESEYIESRLWDLSSDLIRDNSVPVSGGEMIVFKDVKYHPNKYYELNAGYLRKPISGNRCPIVESSVKAFMDLLSEGDIEIVKPLFYVNFENPNPNEILSHSVNVYDQDELARID